MTAALRAALPALLLVAACATSPTGRRQIQLLSNPVFEDGTPNAFALPGGKIGVHTGMLEVARNESARLRRPARGAFVSSRVR